MHQGAHIRKGRPKRKVRYRVNKTLFALLAIVMVIGAVVGTTVAFLVDKTGNVQNTFEYAKVSCEVTETFNGTSKSNVQITNTGTTDAYIRATYVVTWKDAAENVYPEQPQQGVDYTISLNLDQGWIYYNGYYYYTAPVAPDASTGVLIDLCTPVTGRAPEGYTLSVDVLASAIQSVPEDAVKAAWGSGFSIGSDGSLIVPGN